MERQYKDMIEKSQSVEELREISKLLLEGLLLEKTSKEALAHVAFQAHAANHLAELTSQDDSDPPQE